MVSGGSVMARVTSSSVVEALHARPGEQRLLRPHVVVLQVERPQARVAPRQPVALLVADEQALLGHPVELVGQPGTVGLEAVQHVLPAPDDLGADLFTDALQTALALVLLGLLEELPLHLEGRDAPAVPGGDRGPQR